MSDPRLVPDPIARLPALRKPGHTQSAGLYTGQAAFRRVARHVATGRYGVGLRAIGAVWASHLAPGALCPDRGGQRRDTHAVDPARRGRSRHRVECRVCPDRPGHGRHDRRRRDGDEMATLRRRLPGLVHVPLTMRAPGAARPTADLLSRLIPDPALRTVLCCGPQPFMQLVRAVAGSAGVPPDRLGEESLDLSVSQIHPTRQGTETLMRQFTFARSGKSFDCAETSTILAAVRAARLPLPSSCAQGVCGTCNTFKYTGAVAMAHAGGIRQRDIDGGFILPCVSRPLSGIVLD